MGYTGLGQAAGRIVAEEGVAAFWKGNATNVVRIFPYSAAQLMANDQYKRLLAGEDGRLTVLQRLGAGALAGMTATAATHPLDTVRLRLSLPGNEYTGMLQAGRAIVQQEGVASLYRGLRPTLLGIAPYAALNFASYDLLKRSAYQGGKVPESRGANLAVGAVAGTFAASVCYPLDTIRRQFQMRDHGYANVLDAARRIYAKEGWVGFYRGWAANTIKVVPQSSMRFVAYELAKDLLGVKKRATDT